MNERAETPDSVPPPVGKLLAYLQLFRLPNVFTAVADVGMGVILTATGLSHLSGTGWIGPVAALVGISAMLYTAGMVLNDLYDVQVDREQRPTRPLPSGAVSLESARQWGYGLLVAGVGLGWLTGWWYLPGSDLWYRTGLIASLLAMTVVLYDRFLKKTPLAPWMMGGCRFFNVLLGMSLGAGQGNALLWHVPDFTWLGYDASHLMVAGGIGTYIAGVTWFARREAEEEPGRTNLILGAVIMAAGIVMLGLFPRMGVYAVAPHQVPFALGSPHDRLWPLLLVMLSITLFRRIGTTIASASSYSIQVAVKQAIVSLIAFDAALALAVGGPMAGIAIIWLIAPMLLLGRWVYST